MVVSEDVGKAKVSVVLDDDIRDDLEKIAARIPRDAKRAGRKSYLSEAIREVLRLGLKKQTAYDRVSLSPAENTFIDAIRKLGDHDQRVVDALIRLAARASASPETGALVQAFEQLLAKADRSARGAARPARR